MPMYYRRPGVYLEESLLVNPSDVAGTFTVGAFVGAAEKGPVNEPILVESWSDYVTVFGGLNPITQPAGADPHQRHVAADGSGPGRPGGSQGPRHLRRRQVRHALQRRGLHGRSVRRAGSRRPRRTSRHTTRQGCGSLVRSPARRPQRLPRRRCSAYLPFAVYSFFQNGGRVSLGHPGHADRGSRRRARRSTITVNGAIADRPTSRRSRSRPARRACGATASSTAWPRRAPSAPARRPRTCSPSRS